jgi:Mg-chelatase subunit ChlD
VRKTHLQKRVVAGSEDIKLKETSKIEPEYLNSSHLGNQLMNSILQNDKKTVEDGKLIKDSINMGIGIFTPDMLFEQMVKNFSMAEKIFGETIIRQLSGYDKNYIKKNISIPEFQNEIRKNIRENIEELHDKGLIEDDGSISKKGFELASFMLYKEELDILSEKGLLGEKVHKKDFQYGEKQDTVNFRKGSRYRSLAIKESIKLALRRNHNEITEHDLKVFTRKSKSQAIIIYCLDASGSMKGKKIDSCKKAGIALMYKALTEKDKVGLVVFGSDIKDEIPPTQDFPLLLRTITRIQASKETNLTKSIRRSIELFPQQKMTKHMIIISDALPTIGEEPEKEALDMVELAKNHDITVSVIGIDLNQKGQQFAKKIVEISRGNLFITKDLKKLDTIILEDYSTII